MAAGGASTVLAIASDARVPLAQTQKELTPLQRMVLQKAIKEKNERIENETGGGGAGGTQMRRNQHPAAGGAGGSMTGETIRYVNESAKDGGD